MSAIKPTAASLPEAVRLARATAEELDRLRLELVQAHGALRIGAEIALCHAKSSVWSVVALLEADAERKRTL